MNAQFGFAKTDPMRIVECEAMESCRASASSCAARVLIYKLRNGGERTAPATALSPCDDAVSAISCVARLVRDLLGPSGTNSFVGFLATAIARAAGLGLGSLRQ